MVTVTVLRAFHDRQENVVRSVGDVFSATEERARHIDEAIPGYVTYEAVPSDEGGAADYSSMRIGELRALAKERGLRVPRNANKEAIANLLRG